MPKVIFLQDVEFLIQKLIIRVDDSFIEKVADYAQRCMKIMDTSLIGINEVFLEESKEEEVRETVRRARTTVRNSEVGRGEEVEFNKKLITKNHRWHDDHILSSKTHVYCERF